jgi:tetratricopeptide (TPR) repeat protein
MTTDDLSSTMRFMLRAMGSQERLRWVLFLAALALFAAAASATVRRPAASMPSRLLIKPNRCAPPWKPIPKANATRKTTRSHRRLLRRLSPQPRLQQSAGGAHGHGGTLSRDGARIFLGLLLLESIKSYRFLIEQYPPNRISREALFTIGEVYRQDLEDPDEARKAFQDFIAMYPKSDKAGEAKDILKQLDQQAAERAKVHSALGSPPGPRGGKGRGNVSEERSSGLRQVTAVRRWVGPNYLRIVIEVSGEVKFESVRLSNPDRIVVDLQTAHLSPDWSAKRFRWKMASCGRFGWRNSPLTWRAWCWTWRRLRPTRFSLSPIRSAW